VVKRDSGARSFIDEDLLKRAANAECTMDEVNELVARMNKLGIGAVKQRKKDEVEQSQAFSSMTKNSEKMDKKKKEKPKTGSTLSLEDRLKLYQQKVNSLGGSNFPLMDKQIDFLNKHVQKLADGNLFIKKTSSSITVGDAFGSIERVKLPSKPMGDDMWLLFQVIRDIYGCTTASKLSNLGRLYMDKYDPSYLDKVEKWRLKHGVKAQSREKHMANSSISHKPKRDKESKKNSNSKKSRKSSAQAAESDESGSDFDARSATYSGGSDSDNKHSRTSRGRVQSSSISSDSSDSN
jgi:hypothetical protein